MDNTFRLSCNGYTKWKFDSKLIKEKLNRTCKVLRKIQAAGVQFDGVALTGTSGTWLGPLLVMEGFKVVLIRKQNDSNHGSPVEAKHGTYSKLVLVDDLVASGATVRRARDAIREEIGRSEFHFEGVILYDENHRDTYRIDGQQVYGYDY